MQSPPSELRPIRHLLIRILYVVSYAVILYVLSAGPMYWQIYDAFCLDGSLPIRILYFPLVVACEIPFVNRFFNWYLRFWM